MNQNNQISKETAKKLERAYTDLYNTLVREYQNRNKTNGQSWYNAFGAIRQILMMHSNEKNTNPIIVFLFELLDTHKPVVEKKCMESVHRDEVVTNKPNSEEDLQSAIRKFEMVIAAEMRQSATPKKPKNVRIEPFYDWLDTSVNPADTEKLDTDPRQFERLYNKWVRQQKYKRTK